jgi:hypothetical protein
MPLFDARIRLLLLFASLTGQLWGAVSYPPPTRWKGINYSPQRHSYFRMLYEWNQYDSVAGVYVRDMVNADLAFLSQNGFNVVHLYLWDRSLLKSVNGQEPAGFYSCSSDPTTEPSLTPDSLGTPGAQWQALDAFVNMAKNHGLWVILTFANGCVKNQIKAGVSPLVAGQDFATWANKFVAYLSPRHNNILAWGLNWAWEPIDDLANGQSRVAWRVAYKAIDDVATFYSPAPGSVGLMAVALRMYFNVTTGVLPTDIIPRPSSGYVWNWQESQGIAKAMRDELTIAYGYQKDPDIYMPQMYTANARDIREALHSLTTVWSSNGIPIPASKIFVSEFATSSSLTSPPNGNNVMAASMEDAQTPTTTPIGQSEWINNVLCGYTAVGINKFAYWSLYDPYTLWTGPPWEMDQYDPSSEPKPGYRLAWNGFWGLFFESGTAKPGWSILRNYYLYGTLQCSNPLTSIIALQLESDYYTVAQPIEARWTAADRESLTLSQGNDGSRSCFTNNVISTTGLVGSCAFTNASPFYQTGTQTITLSAINGGVITKTTSASVSIGLGPIVQAVSDANYSSYITSNSTIIVWGRGFSKEGGNTLQFTRPGYADVWMYEGDGHYYWNGSVWQINASLDGRLAPGTWTLYVRNGYSGTPSSPYIVTVY